MLKYIAVISENIFDKYVFWDNTFYEYKTSYNKKRIYLPIDKEETATILNLKDIDFDSLHIRAHYENIYKKYYQTECTPTKDMLVEFVLENTRIENHENHEDDTDRIWISYF